MSGTYPRLTHIPPRLAGLADLAYNLWWSWHPEARILFKQLNQLAWKASVHNPVLMLRDTPREFFLAAEQNEEYLRRYDIIMNRFGRYMNTTTGWFREEYPDQKALTIAYSSAEYGLHHSLPMYAGGVGVPCRRSSQGVQRPWCAAGGRRVHVLGGLPPPAYPA